MYSEIVPRTMPLAEMLARDRRASSSRAVPRRCTSTTRRAIDPAIYDSGVPVLGICYGAQLVAQQLGGEVRQTGSGEYGRTELTRSGRGVGAARRTSRRTGRVDEPRRRDRRRAPPGFVVTASSPGAPVAALEDPRARRLRRAVPPRGARTPSAARKCSSVPVRRVRLPAHVDEHVDHRAGRRRGPRPGRATSG